jgi:hypothetical protein
MRRPCTGLNLSVGSTRPPNAIPTPATTCLVGSAGLARTTRPCDVKRIGTHSPVPAPASATRAAAAAAAAATLAWRVLPSAPLATPLPPPLLPLPLPRPPDSAASSAALASSAAAAVAAASAPRRQAPAFSAPGAA